MSRMPRTYDSTLPMTYHVVSRCALGKDVITPEDRTSFLEELRRCVSRFFVEVLGVCVMGDHFHLVVRTRGRGRVGDEELAARYRAVRGEEPSARNLEAVRDSWTSLSDFVRELKQSFSRYYNRQNKRRGPFWGFRFQSLFLEDGQAVLDCLAYMDTNPLRAGLADKPEDYPWCTLGLHARGGDADAFLSVDYRMPGWEGSREEMKRMYRDHVYATGAMDMDREAREARIAGRPGMKPEDYTRTDRFIMHSRWFLDGLALGSPEFVSTVGREMGCDPRGSRTPKPVPGLAPLYSFRNLTEVLGQDRADGDES